MAYAGKLRLGVNIDHVATVRNARGGAYPDPIRAAKLAEEAGADGITAHLREDRRHISDADIDGLMEALDVPLNFEMAATEEMQAIALRHKPHAVCIVPEKREERTTEGGLEVAREENRLAHFIAPLRETGCRVSIFIAADAKQIEAAHRIGAEVIELHTGAYCDAHAEGHFEERDRELQALPGFADGAFSVQDQGAQRAVPLLGARPGERVLDACAAPGGKSCQLLEERPDLQRLEAVDIRPERLARVEQNLRRLNLERESSVKLHCADVRRVEDWWDGVAFDRILLDAPCSATGVIRRHPDILHLRRAGDIEASVRLQGELLDALWPLLKPGGTLLYASCSLLAEENQLCIASFAKRQRNVECTPMSVPCAVEHLHGYTVLPDAEGGDGLFFARLQRPAPQCKS